LIPHSPKSSTARIANTQKVSLVRFGVIRMVDITIRCDTFVVKRKGEMMTDTEMARRKAICSAAGVNDIGEVSDGFHTFNGLYEQRMILFAALVKAYKSKAWKSYRHEDGEYCFGGGWFIVGIDTPEGNYTYHYENKYWDMFDCIDLPRAPHWDGHTEADAETRLMSLEPEIKTDGDTISRAEAIETVKFECGEWKGLAQTIVNGIKKLPSAQPEIIRCKDCKHRGEKPIADGQYWCDLHGTFMYYCSDAERRTDEGFN